MEIILLICIISNNHVKHSTSDIFLKFKKNLKKKIIFRLLGAEIKFFFKSLWLSFLRLRVPSAPICQGKIEFAVEKFSNFLLPKKFV